MPRISTAPTDEDRHRPALSRRDWLIAALLALAAALPYWQARHFDFVNYDDLGYIVKNPAVKHGLTGETIAWAFTSLEMANWHPVTWLSYMVDVALFGDGPRGFHLTNILLHAINAALLYLVLMRLMGSRDAWWRAALVAALFALHPLHVESVAWISERKDLLSVLFGLLAINTFVSWAGQKSVARYALIVVWFALSLMSKPMLVTLPCVLLLLDVWPLKRWSLGKGFDFRIVLEKAPLFGLSIASSVMTVIAQSKSGAMKELEHLPLSVRLANAAVSYAQYLADTVWPASLTVLYPHPGSWPAAVTFLAAAALGVLTLIALLLWQRCPAALIGWLWYLGTLVPVIGIVQVGEQARADRYTYFPLIGIFLAVAWCLPAIHLKPLRQRRAASAAIIVVMAVLTRVTWQQIGYWRSSRTLFERALAVTKDNYSAHNNLGLALVQDGQLEEGLRHFELALEIHPNLADAYSNLGDACLVMNRLDEAIAHYQRVLEHQPENALVRTNLAAAYLKLQQNDLAIEQLKHVVELQPQSVDARFNLGVAYDESGRVAEAAEQFQRVVQEDADRVEAWKRLGMLQARMGRGDEAIAAFRRAVALQASDVSSFMNIAALLLQKPDRQSKDAGEAIQIARHAVDLTGGSNPPALLLLAQAHAAAGQRPEALTAAEQALRVSQQIGDQAMIAEANDLISALQSQ